MNLKELEARLQNLIEVRLLSVLPGQKLEDMVIQKLAAAMHANLVVREGGITVAPNVYTIIVHPSSAAQWQQPRLLETLMGVLKTAGQEAGFIFPSQPEITISTDKSFSLNDVSVMASQRVEPMAETKGMSSGEMEESEGLAHLPQNAFLIIEGVKVFPLSLPVVNIGRRMDNQLVIDDPRVSRNHAQLRAINGRFVLFDLNSTGGTFVNGQRASQTVLYAGDVISLAGVALIFGQDNPPHRSDNIDTSPLQPAASERPTAIIKDHQTAELKKKKE
jgi:hypothetical protein